MVIIMNMIRKIIAISAISLLSVHSFAESEKSVDLSIEISDNEGLNFQSNETLENKNTIEYKIKEFDLEPLKNEEKSTFSNTQENYDFKIKKVEDNPPAMTIEI